MSNRTYRYFKGTPRYPFGHGLSDSRFSYADLVVSPSPLKAGDSLSVTATVTNLSDIPGDEVAQLYLEFPDLPGAPIRALRGFARVPLKARETKKVSFELSPRDLSHVTAEGVRIVGAGQYRVSVGGGQPNTGCPFISGTLEIRERVTLPK